MMNDRVTLLNMCMDVLCNNVGVLAAEKFIYLIRSENFDYTKWQREYYDSMTPDQIKQELDSFSAANPFEGKKAEII